MNLDQEHYREELQNVLSDYSALWWRHYKLVFCLPPWKYLKPGVMLPLISIGKDFNNHEWQTARERYLGFPSGEEAYMTYRRDFNAKTSRRLDEVEHAVNRSGLLWLIEQFKIKTIKRDETDQTQDDFAC